MKILFRNSIHNSDRSNDCLIGEIGKKKVKFTYTVDNIGERCNIEVFDGNKFNSVLCMLDMGIVPDEFPFMLDANKRKEQADRIFKKSEIILTQLIIE